MMQPALDCLNVAGRAFLAATCPALIPYPHLDPVIFRIGNLAVRWYGVAYLLGFILAFLLLRRMARRGELRMAAERVGDAVSWMALGVIIGGRVGWWLFYHRDPGYPEPWYEPLAMWRGGMSFHGGLIGVAVAALLWARKNRVPFFNLADCVAIVAPIGLFFGRIANFINGELVGRPTSVPWAMIFPGYTQPRHPSQLYEAFLEGPVLLAILWLAYRKFRPREGRIFALLMIAYGLLRFAVEFTRQPDAQLGYLVFGSTMGQLLSLTLVLAGVILWFLVPRCPPQTAANPPQKTNSATLLTRPRASRTQRR